MPTPEAGRVPEWTVADRLRKAREAAGMEQTQLAQVAGISRATISAAENGSRPARATMRLWALATGVPLVWIETGETHKRAAPLSQRRGSYERRLIANVLEERAADLQRSDGLWSE